MNLNLGCGKRYKDGYINVDNSKYVKKDLDWDLNKYPFPFRDDSFSKIRCWAVMEHLEDIVAFLKEIHRILKPGGVFKFRVPLAFTCVDCVDITHKQHFSPRSFDLFFGKFKGSKYFDFKFKGKVWVTCPIFHSFKFHKNFYYLNSIINNLFTGLEGKLMK